MLQAYEHFCTGSGDLKILIVTDAWHPQINGVVRTLQMLGDELRALDHDVRYVTPEGRFSMPLPTYPEIRLALFAHKGLEKEICDFAPDAVHIATEGPLGLAARAICIQRGIGFSTSFHTRFPEYVHARFAFVPAEPVYRWLRWFHGPAEAVLAPTQSLKRELAAHGFKNLRIWSRGVDIDHFRPIPDARLPYDDPIWLYVGRVAVEKNIEAFLALDLPGTKLVVGDGPARAALTAKYPKVRFAGTLTGEALVRAYAASTVFVFPSRTDTFGLVLLEALACGLPVAAYPVAGPLDVVGDAPVGVLDEDLGYACRKALEIARAPASPTPRQFARSRSWRACTLQFLRDIMPDPDPD
jgi:glycosyltransferase involved in cell wall biosynthesis